MKLVTFRVREFKSIRDSGDIPVGEITCLVGKNEAGKTALLEALYRLKPIGDKSIKFSVTHDYPRSDVEDYEQAIEAKKREHAEVITATYELEDEDIKSVEAEFGNGIFSQRSVTLRMGYSNSRNFTIHVDELKIVKALVESSGLKGKLASELKKCKTVTALDESCHSASAEMQQKYDSAMAAATAITDETKKSVEIKKAERLKEPESLQQLRSRTSTLKKTGVRSYIWEKHLSQREPRYLYFDEYFQMTGEVNVERLKERVAGDALDDSDRPMLGLIQLARLDLDRLLSPKDTEDLINKLEGASNHLSKQLLKYWSQNKHLQMTFDIRPATPGDPEGMQKGTNLWARVYDSIHQATTRLGKRSRGFVWFFSFLAYFSQQKKIDQKLILLLDEPGLFLHGTAQHDLLRYVEEELRPDHQVIYTTHSPFMVDPEDFARVRIVEDKSLDEVSDQSLESPGVKVTADVLEVSQGSLFPLQHALGYSIAQTLFVGPYCLIVEGVSDLMYIQTFSHLLQEAGRESLDERWVITPVGGADKIPTFVALLGAQKGLTLATLIDMERGRRQKVEDLYKSKLLRKKNVVTFADILGVKEADVEDMLGVDLYLSLVNGEYESSLQAPIELKDLPSRGARLLTRLSEYFQSNPMQGDTQFNHYRPARFFVEHVSDISKAIGSATLNDFESAFARINALL